MEIRAQSLDGAPDGPEFWTSVRLPKWSSTAFAKQRPIRAEAFSGTFPESPPRPNFSQVSRGAPTKKLAPGCPLSPPDHHVQDSEPSCGEDARLQSSRIPSGPVSVRASASAREKASRMPEMSSFFSMVN